MTINNYIRSIPTRFQVFNPDEFRVFEGIWLSGDSTVHVFTDDPGTLTSLITKESTVVMHLPNQSRGDWSAKINQLSAQSGFKLSFHGDPLSVAFASDADRLLQLLLQAVPLKNTRLIILCRFGLSSNRSMSSEKASIIRLHAQQREITILEPVKP